ncbi:Sodium/hydrogen exchanger family-domain-containing protein [Chlamydoabsidia padenii]|nr:Sodium/hydrogen exchanger family-domain-containing protein [Chlamydoabsidia padenii]
MVKSATPQAGVFSGLNPSSFNASDPIVLFIIQLTIILTFCRALAVPLGYFRQPKVISEVIAGIILGPSVMGRIPGYMDHIFPAPSLPFLNLVATIGLVFFLFQVGLEVDVRVIRRDWKRSFSVAVAGMALPFGLGTALSLGLYKLQDDPSIPFSSFLLFLGVAVSITAFPVLARILAELKLLGTKVGAITMAAGLINDCTAWVLLALVVALLNATGGLEALYVFLTTVAFALFLIFLVGPLYYRLCVKTDSFENGPSPLLMTVTLMMVLISAFVTNIIGVHAIFGGFLAGVIIPHESNLPIRITEKIEDIVNILFLPLYFTLSGLKTQIGLLNTGIVWGYVILTIVVACFGKITGCSLAAKVSGMTTRESLAVGFLMNCKGLVELIVLNIGHDAGVLNDQVFVIMVVMALVTTIMTTPFVVKLYPEWYQKQQAALTSGDGAASIDSIDAKSTEEGHVSNIAPMDNDRFTMVTLLNRLETIPAAMTLIRLLTPKDDDDRIHNKPQIHALRLLELTQRPSDVMKIQEMKETVRVDPVLSVIRTFAHLIGIPLTPWLYFAAPSSYIKHIDDYASSVNAHLVLLPWQVKQQMYKVIEEHKSLDRPTTAAYQLSDAEFANHAFMLDHCTVGLFLDRGLEHRILRIIVPFLGGKDDRAALLFALRLQVYHQAQVMVLRQQDHQDNQTMYATGTAIHAGLTTPSAHLDDTQFLDTLFHSTTHTLDVSCQSVKELTAYYLMSMVTRQDLIILGRRHTGVTLSSSTVDTPGTAYSKEFGLALGPLAFDLLSTGVDASLVVIQAPSRNHSPNASSSLES